MSRHDPRKLNGHTRKAAKKAARWLREGKHFWVDGRLVHSSFWGARRSESGNITGMMASKAPTHPKDFREIAPVFRGIFISYGDRRIRKSDPYAYLYDDYLLKRAQRHKRRRRR